MINFVKLSENLQQQMQQKCQQAAARGDGGDKPLSDAIRSATTELAVTPGEKGVTFCVMTAPNNVRQMLCDVSFYRNKEAFFWSLDTVPKGSDWHPL